MLTLKITSLIFFSPQSGDLSADNGAHETEVRLEKCKQDIRKAETECLQGEARLSLLRDTNVDLDSWIESAKNQVIT